MRHLPFAPPERKALLLLFCCVSAAALGRSLAVLPLFIEERRRGGGFAESVNGATTATTCFFSRGNFPVGGGSPVVHTPTASYSHPISFKHRDQGSPSQNTYSLPANLLVAAALLGHIIADLLFRQSEKVFFRLVLIVTNQIKPKTFTVSVQPCCSGSSPRTSTLDTLSSS